MRPWGPWRASRSPAAASTSPYLPASPQPTDTSAQTAPIETTPLAAQVPAEPSAAQPYEAAVVQPGPEGPQTAAYPLSTEPAAQPYQAAGAEPQPITEPHDAVMVGGVVAQATGSSADVVPPGETGGVEPAAEDTGAQGKPSGLRRALVIGGATAAALLVLGLASLAAIFAFGLFGSSTPPPATTTGPSAGSKVATGTSSAGKGSAGQSIVITSTAESGAEAVTVTVVTNADVFAVRDPFKPLLEPLPAETASTSTSTTASTTTSTTSSTTSTGSASASTVGSDTLTLVSISTDNGVRVANVTLGSTPYSLTAGQKVDDSPWQVLSVEDDYVIMLYGDEQITLSVGQGLTK